MRRVSLLAAAGVLATPFAAFSMPLNESLLDRGVASSDQGSVGRVMYNNGTRLEFNDFSMKLNLLVQAGATYNDYDDVAGRPDAQYGVEDNIDFDMKRVRLILSGDMLNKEFSYLVENDFSNGVQGDGSHGSELKDAWIEWNVDEAANLRMGQQKRPYSLQSYTGDSQLQFINRSAVTNAFIPESRDVGVQSRGVIGDGVMYGIGIFNGDSDSEGANLGGVDNKINATAQIAMNIGDYGDRYTEGDLRSDTSSFAATTGVGVQYGQGSTIPTDADDVGSDFDKTDVNVNLGTRFMGWSTQSEFFYTRYSLDDIPGDGGDGDNYGFYMQTGYFFVPQQWEAAFRFGWVSPDADFVGNQYADGSVVDTGQEYTFGVNYFINGHNLKLQANISIIDSNYEDEFAAGEDNTTDVRYGMQISGMM